jgi:hypothetical protein
MNALNTESIFYNKLAEKEHAAMTSTIRDRLINSVTERKRKLQKDINNNNDNINDSNSLLFHPGQYSINPSSPGGVLGKRSSRHRRDLDDYPSLLDSKRKRRAFDDGRGSPAPSTRRAPLDSILGTPTPAMLRSVDKSSDPETSAYTVEKLFTDKELSMLERQAAEAAHRYMVRHNFNDAHSLTNGSGASIDADATSESDRDASPAVAQAMDRTTRSTRGVGAQTGFITSTGIEVVADLTLPSTFTGMQTTLPKLPPPLYMVVNKGAAKGESGRPLLTEGVNGDELAIDMNRIQWGRDINVKVRPGASLDESVQVQETGAVVPGDRQFLAAAVAPVTKYSLWLSKGRNEPRSQKEEDEEEEDGEGEGLGKKTAARRLLAGEGDTPASGRSSRAGSEVSAPPMSRQNSGFGSVPMSRENSRRGGRR